MAPKWTVYIAHRWRIPKLMYGLFVLEVPLTIGALVLFGVADPNTYRTTMWQIGSDNGFNSNPNSILYEYANYLPVHTPLIWSGFMTQFNVVISVLSMFILLVKSTMFVLHSFLPIFSCFTHLILLALYALAVRNQATPDLSDMKVPHLSKHLPWYLSNGCSYATGGDHGYCLQARASFAITCVMLGLFATYLGVAIHSAIITPEEKSERMEDFEESIEMKGYYDKDVDAETGETKEEKWERNRQAFMNMPKTPVTPFGRPPGMMSPRQTAFTPRTTAFNQLSGQQGEPSAIGRGPISSRAGPARPLQFREQYGERQYEDVPVPEPMR